MAARTTKHPSPDPDPDHDPGHNPLIRISPTRIHTQVTHSVRYRPVRSLLFLGVLVILSLFVLFTLSQMAVVQHTMIAHLEAGRAGSGVGVGVGGGSGSGRPAKRPQKTWRSQFSQFKIEPLLVRNAPSVEVNSALAANRRQANKVAALIVRNSLLVTQSGHRHDHSSTKILQTHNSSARHPPLLDQFSHPSALPPPVNANNGSLSRLTTKPTVASSSSSLHIPADQFGARRTGDEMGANNTAKNTESSGGKNETTSETNSKKGRTRDRNTRVGDKENTSEQVNSKTGRGKGPMFTLKGGRKKASVSVKCDDENNRMQEYGAEKCDSLVPDPPLAIPKPFPRAPSGPPDAAGVKVEYPNTTTTTDGGAGNEDYEPIDSDVDGLASMAGPTKGKARRRPLGHEASEEHLQQLQLCPEIPPGLYGHLRIDLEALEKLKLEEVLKQLQWVAPGGSWSPTQDPQNPCLPRHKVAVVLPYRDRLHHLVILLSWLHPILRRQQLEYTVYVAEQAGNATFNKGSIMNAGFLEAWQRSEATCFVFHDVDLLPEDDRNMYSCPPHPRHLSVGVDTLGYKLPYFLLVGGVLSVRGDQFLQLNGYSNMYWGWGGEDDDMGYRIKQSGLSITRPPYNLAKYTMIRHLKRRPLTWKVRGKLLRTSGRRYRLDGLNTLHYSLLALHRHPLFTHLLLDVGTPPENLVKLDAH